MSQTSWSEEERQQLLRQYAEIATLAGGLAHEIKNPLGTISMNLELLVEDLEESESPRDKRMLRKIQTIQQQCEHLVEILDDFLKFARVGELELVPCDLNQQVREFTSFFEAQAASKGIEISPHLASDLPKVKLDANLFRQVLMNLTLNALQAMPQGGLLELQTAGSEGRVFLHLIDNGIGMDARTIEKIFDPFFSTKPGGSGLGLPTVRKIIEAHGGDISVLSEPGKGTRFTLSLPSDATANLA
ncbi:MAG: ATP-binding protein [Planctomycetales bacterium]